MKLLCDLCGNILTETDHDHAICPHCGMEYGPDRLRELRVAAPPAEPHPKATAEPEPQQKQKSGCGIWFCIIMAILDLVIGTHGIVAVFCLIAILIISWLSKKK